MANRDGTPFVLGADTAVVCRTDMLPKPSDSGEARADRTLLSGRRHAFLGGIYVIYRNGSAHNRDVKTVVVFKRFTDQEIDWYIRIGGWPDRAVGSPLQGRAARLVNWIQGSYSNVVGIPLYETVNLLGGPGIRAEF